MNKKFLLYIASFVLMISSFAFSNGKKTKDVDLGTLLAFNTAQAEFVKTCNPGYIANKDEYWDDGIQYCNYSIYDCCKDPNN